MKIKTFKTPRSIKVLIAEPSEVLRTEISKALRNFGFEQFNFTNHIKYVPQILKTEDIDWLICSCFLDNSVNLNAFINREVKIDKIAVTALIEKNELNQLTKLFSSGIMSYIEKPFTGELLKSYFQQLFAIAKASEWQGSLVAASYLRNYLRDKNKHEELLQLEESLVQYFPKKAELLIKLADAQKRIGYESQSIETLDRAITLHPNLKDQIDRIKSAQKTDQKDNNSIIQRAILIEHNEEYRKLVVEELNKLGIDKIVEYQNKDQAWAALKKTTEILPEMIIINWNGPGMPSEAFIQRIYHSKYFRVPILVTGSKITKDDIPLMSELGIMNVLVKDFSPEEFSLAFRWTNYQNTQPTEQRTIEIKLRQYFEDANTEQSAPLFSSYIANPIITDARKKLMEAYKKYCNGEYALAKYFVSESIQNTKNKNIFALNLYAKCLQELGEKELAIEHYEQAQKISEKNIDRICQMAHLYAEIEDFANANIYLDKAARIDAESQQLALTSAIVAFHENNPAKAREILEKTGTVRDCAALLNNKAVVLIRNMEFEKGIDFYQKALETIPDNYLTERNFILYNFCLSLIKSQQLERAQLKLTEIKHPKPSLEEKVNSLHTRLRYAIENNEPLYLNQPNDFQDQNLSSYDAQIIQDKFKKNYLVGQYFLKNIFYLGDSDLIHKKSA